MNVRLNIGIYHGGAIDWASRLAREFPDARITVCPDDQHDIDGLDEIEVLIGWQFPPDLLQRLRKVRWIQLISSGADDVTNSPWVEWSVAITNTKGVYADSVAEYVMWALLTLFRNFHRVLRNQSRRRWRQVPATSLAGRTVAIVGVGHVGRAVASRAQHFGLRVVGVKRSVTAQDRPAGVDRLYGREGLPDVLREADAIVLAVPLTPETRLVIDQEAFRTMKRGAVLINVARAALVDQQALMAALRDGRLGGAALDVFEHEPLSRWSRLWRVENLIVTPHMAGLTAAYPERVADLLCDNIRRYRAGEPLRNRVDRTKGY